MSESVLQDERNVAWAEWLWRRGEQPGVVRLARARATAVRLTHLNTPPLADEVARRYAAVMALQERLPPIVYAEPLPATPESATAVTIPFEKKPLPIVTAQPTAVPASPPPTILPETPMPTTTRQASTAVPNPPPLSPTAQPSSHTVVSAPPPPTTRPSVPEPLPVVRAASQPVRPAQPAKTPVLRPSTTETDTAVIIPQPAISVPERERRERPSPSPIAPVLPVVRAAVSTPPAVIARDVPQPMLPSPPVVTPARISPPEVKGTSNGRASTPLPLVPAQPTAVVPSPAAPIAQPLPLAHSGAAPMGGVIQRAADTAVPRPAAKPQPTPMPTPNRVVRTNSVIQRANGEGETAVSHSQADDGGETTDAQIDMDELVEKVHRRFLRKLAVEGERRGKTIWP